VTEPTNPINSFGPATPRLPPTITYKKIHSRNNTAAAPPHETAKNAMATPSSKEGGADHKKDSEKAKS
jgi:hypothetical protein